MCADFPDVATEPRIVAGNDYVESLRGRNFTVYLFGQRVEEPVDHPMIRPSANAVRETYEVAAREPELASTISPFTGERASRFLHVCESVGDLTKQNRMQRKPGQLTGTCFQRCAGMDHIITLLPGTYEIDERRGTNYPDRLKPFVTRMHRRNHIIGGAMTDVKADRSLMPHQQENPDLLVNVTRRTEDSL